MSDNQSSKLPERNPVTYKDFRRQITWQIIIPIVVGFLILVALGVLAALGGNAAVARWADISLIWLILSWILFALILTIVFAGLAVLVYLIIKGLPSYALQAQDLIFELGVKVREASDAAVEPVMRAQSYNAGLRAFWRNLRRDSSGD